MQMLSLSDRRTYSSVDGTVALPTTLSQNAARNGSSESQIAGCRFFSDVRRVNLAGGRARGGALCGKIYARHHAPR